MHCDLAIICMRKLESLLPSLAMIVAGLRLSVKLKIASRMITRIVVESLRSRSACGERLSHLLRVHHNCEEASATTEPQSGVILEANY